MGRRKLLSDDRVVGAINRWLVEHGVPPTVEELRRSLGVGSTRTTLRYLDHLKENGEIDRWPGARGLRLRKAPDARIETRLVPIVGEAPAGPLMLAEENRQGWVRLPKDFCRPPSAEFFLLRVRGDSMNQAKVAGECIESGDLVLVRQQATADQGQIIVALVDGQATIKWLICGPGYYMLKPASSNKNHEPIVVKRDFQVQGVVCQVLKKGSEILESMY
jgi:repressor LexA